jgi:hypothetical protein
MLWYSGISQVSRFGGTLTPLALTLVSWQDIFGS